ncbi:MAG TPA: hypothetical protein VH640_13990 [Bryobacteraceae bacterium]
MRRLILATLIAGAVCAAAGDVSGNWKVTGSIGQFAVNLVCSFHDAGGKLTGSCKGEDIGEVQLTGEEDGKTVKWSYNVNFQGMPLTVNYAGTLDSATAMKGQISVMGTESGSFAATKQ